MKMGIYALYDRVAEECGPVWTAKNDAVAIRNAMISLKEVRADEHLLYYLGSFDNEAISIECEGSRRVVMYPKEEA